MRFQVVDAQDRASEAWRVETRLKTTNIYIGSRSRFSEVKVSLHESGVWQHGLTAERGAPMAGIDPKDRLFQRWEHHPELVPGWQRPVQIILSNSELRADAPEQPDSVIRVPAPTTASSSIVEVWIETPGIHAPLRVDAATQIGMMELVNGGSLWVVNRAVDLPWLPSKRFATQVGEARKSRESSALPTDGVRRIVLHGVEESSGTLILCELAVD